jgi:hypothetical protein
VVDLACALRTVIGDDLTTLGERTATTLVARTSADVGSLDPFLPMPRAAQIIQVIIDPSAGVGARDGGGQNR